MHRQSHKIYTLLPAVPISLKNWCCKIAGFRFLAWRCNDGGMVGWGLETNNPSAEYKLNKLIQ